MVQIKGHRLAMEAARTERRSKFGHEVPSKELGSITTRAKSIQFNQQPNQINQQRALTHSITILTFHSNQPADYAPENQPSP